jgi:hypothetical protein
VTGESKMALQRTTGRETELQRCDLMAGSTCGASRYAAASGWSAKLFTRPITRALLALLGPIAHLDLVYYAARHGMKIFLLGTTFFSFLAGTLVSAATAMWIGVLLTPPSHPVLLGLAGLAFALSAAGFIFVAVLLEGLRSQAHDEDLLPYLHDSRHRLMAWALVAAMAAAAAFVLIALGR